MCERAHLPTRRGGVAIGDGGQIPRDDRKEVRRLEEWVLPHGEVPAVAQLARLEAVPVAEEQGQLGLVRLDSDLAWLR